MGMYKIFGMNRRGEHRGLCNMRAGSADEALNMAKGIYGSLFVDGCQGYNDMCEECSLLGHVCEGSHSQVWTGCVRRKEAENKALFPGDQIMSRGKIFCVSVILAQLFTGGMTVDKFVLTAVNAFVVALATYGSYELTFAKIERDN